MLARLVLGLAASASLGWAAGHAFPARPPAPPAKPAAGSHEFNVKMHDDSQLAVVLLDSSITVSTKYGKLVVPAADVRRSEPGFRYAAGVEERVNKAIDDLGAAEYKHREEAEGVLISLGLPAVPGVRRATKSADPEVANRAAAVLKALRKKVPDEQMELQDHDVVETTEFTLRGRIEATQVKVRTKHFGDAALPLADIRTFAAAAKGGATDITVDAFQYAKTNNGVWMETKVEVSDGQQLTITATGQIDQWPQQPGQYMCNPAGQQTVNGMVQPNRVVAFGPNGAVAAGTSGQLVGRVGPNGATFVIGAGYKGPASGSGKLYLRIGGSPWGVDSSGSYSVKVSVGR